MGMNSSKRYAELKKPAWAPPAWVFGPVWTLLYAIIAVTFGAVFVAFTLGNIPAVMTLPFILNLVANAAFTPIQFRLKNNALATADIVAVLGTLIWAMAAIHNAMPWIAYAQMPYLLWVTFATCLQIAITWMNRK